MHEPDRAVFFLAGETAFGDHCTALLQQLNPGQGAITRVDFDKLLP